MRLEIKEFEGQICIRIPEKHDSNRAFVVCKNPEALPPVDINGYVYGKVFFDAYEGHATFKGSDYDFSRLRQAMADYHNPRYTHSDIPACTGIQSRAMATINELILKLGLDWGLLFNRNALSIPPECEIVCREPEEGPYMPGWIFGNDGPPIILHLERPKFKIYFDEEN